MFVFMWIVVILIMILVLIHYLNCIREPYTGKGEMYPIDHNAQYENKMNPLGIVNCAPNDPRLKVRGQKCSSKWKPHYLTI